MRFLGDKHHYINTLFFLLSGKNTFLKIKSAAQKMLEARKYRFFQYFCSIYFSIFSIDRIATAKMERNFVVQF